MVRALLSFLESKRFWMLVAAVVVPWFQDTLGIDPETARNVFYALLALVVGDTFRPLKPKPIKS